MRTFIQIACLSVIVAFSGPVTHAQDSVPSPPKYQLELIRIYDTDPPEWIFSVGRIGFKSIDSLKKFLSNVPPGSTLEWAPGCIRIGGEPFSSSDELEDFKAFCAEKQINFVILPAG